MIFLFVGFCASFREDFNHLLAMSNTRSNQFLSILSVMLTASLAYTALGLVFRVLESVLESIVTEAAMLFKLQDYFRGFAADRLAVTGSEMLLYLTGFLAVSAFGTLAGVLFYRYGKYVMVPFWICFGCSFIVVPILAASSQWFIRLMTWFFGLDKAMPEVTAGVHLLALAALLLLLAGLFIRKVPQNA